MNEIIFCVYLCYTKNFLYSKSKNLKKKLQNFFLKTIEKYNIGCLI